METLRATGEPLPLADLAASFEAVVADVLVERSLRCARDRGLQRLVMVGGVAANRRLRLRMQERAEAFGVSVSVAPLAYCTDNAAMIGAAALERLSRSSLFSSSEIGVSPRWPLQRANELYGEMPAF